MDKRNRTSPASAAEEYRQRAQAIDALLDELRQKLDAHAARAAAAPKNWTYAGDLGHVEEVLLEIVTFMR